MKYPVVIVDDEPNGAEALKLLIKANCPDLEVKAIAYNVEDAVSAIEKCKPFIVFLDIEMPGGSGFDVIEQTTNIKYNVIFTTAYQEYALQAIKASAIDYLLKPIIVEELKKAVGKAMKNNESKLTNFLSQIEQLSEKLLNTNKIPVPCLEGLIFVDTNSIIRLEADSNYTHIYLAGGKSMTTARTLKDFEKILPPNFIRIHTTHFININNIVKYIKGDGGNVVLDDGNTVPVSRSYKMSFLQKISSK